MDDFGFIEQQYLSGGVNTPVAKWMIEKATSSMLEDWRSSKKRVLHDGGDKTDRQVARKCCVSDSDSDDDLNRAEDRSLGSGGQSSGNALQHTPDLRSPRGGCLECAAVCLHNE